MALQTAPIESTVFTRKMFLLEKLSLKKVRKFLFRKLGTYCVQEICISDTSLFYTAFHNSKKRFSVIGCIFSKTIDSSSSVGMCTEISRRVPYSPMFFLGNGASQVNEKFLLLRYWKNNRLLSTLIGSQIVQKYVEDTIPM